jgi:hypothetical protein
MGDKTLGAWMNAPGFGSSVRLLSWIQQFLHLDPHCVVVENTTQHIDRGGMDFSGATFGISIDAPTSQDRAEVEIRDDKERSNRPPFRLIGGLL